MARLDRARFDRAIFPFEYPVPTRFSDLDLLRHINNVAMAEILQEARINFSRAFGIHKLVRERRLVVASSTIEFAQEMQYPDPLLVSVGLIDVGRTSYRVAQVARQNGRVGAYAEIVQVASDGARSVPFDDEWRAQLERLKLVDPSPENGD